MAFNVRAFGFRGIVQMLQVNPRQMQSDSVSTLVWPYEWAELLVVNGATPPAFTTQSPDLATILRLEIPDGQQIRYELNPPNRAVVVGASSPSIGGKENFNWGPGWSISICDAASFA